MAGPVPQEWTNLNTALHEATVAEAYMRDPQASDAMRDAGTQRYVAAADAIIANLQVLREQQVLGRITAFLSKRERK
jgi:hypothetical protein